MRFLGLEFLFTNRTSTIIYLMLRIKFRLKSQRAHRPFRPLDIPRPHVGPFPPYPPTWEIPLTLSYIVKTHFLRLSLSLSSFPSSSLYLLPAGLYLAGPISTVSTGVESLANKSISLRVGEARLARGRAGLEMKK